MVKVNIGPVAGKSATGFLFDAVLQIRRRTPASLRRPAVFAGETLRYSNAGAQFLFCAA